MIETLSVEGEGAFNSTLRKNKMPDGNETTPHSTLACPNDSRVATRSPADWTVYPPLSQHSVFSARLRDAKSKNPGVKFTGVLVLATSYSRTAFRRTTIGAAAFHFRVRNGNGWCHYANVTRAEKRLRCSTLVAALRAARRW